MVHYSQNLVLISTQNGSKVAESAAFRAFFAMQTAVSCQFQHPKMEAKQGILDNLYWIIKR